MIRSAQSLIALSRHWHLFCFSCARCKRYLTNEYMDKLGREGGRERGREGEREREKERERERERERDAHTLFLIFFLYIQKHAHTFAHHLQYTHVHYTNVVFYIIYNYFCFNSGDQAFCEPCFQELYGLICETCEDYITGTVLEVMLTSPFSSSLHPNTHCQQLHKHAHVVHSGLEKLFNLSTPILPPYSTVNT